MIVVNALRLALTFQQVMLKYLKDPDAVRTYATDGSSVAITSDEVPGITLKFDGVGLSEGAGGSLNGQVTNFAFVEDSSGARLDGLLPVVLLLSEMVVAALSGSGVLGAINYAVFYQLLMPLLVYQLLYTGGNLGEVVEGFDGNDVIGMGGGNDTYLLGNGNDTVDGGAGSHDKVSGKNLEHGIKVDLAAGTIKEKGTTNTASVTGIEDVDGSAKGDQIYGDEGKNRLIGKDGNDFLHGRNGNDLLKGGNGDDKLVGGNGRDRMYGGDGDDVLVGGNDNDVINSGAGMDIAIGGNGSDRFIFDPGDEMLTITDFMDDVDKLDLRGFFFADIAEARSYASNVNGDVVISLPGGDTVVVEGITRAMLFDGDVLI